MLPLLARAKKLLDENTKEQLASLLARAEDNISRKDKEIERLKGELNLEQSEVERLFAELGNANKEIDRLEKMLADMKEKTPSVNTNERYCPHCGDLLHEDERISEEKICYGHRGYSDSTNDMNSF